MAERGRGKKENTAKNYQANKEWQAGKKLGRKKQKWAVDHWEKA